MKNGKPNVLSINRNKPFDPIEFFGGGWSIWRGHKEGKGLEGKEEQDIRGLKFVEIDFSKLIFESCLIRGESVISGEEKLKRHMSAGHICLDAKVAQCLLEESDWMTLEWIHKTFGVSSLEFVGTTLRSCSGRRAVVVLCRDLDPAGRPRWRKTYEWLKFARYNRSPSAVLLS